MRRQFSPSEWAAQHIWPAAHEQARFGVNTPGAVLIQIDGLGYDQLLKAIDKKRLPFIQRLVQRDHFVLRKFYSGLPSATPAVQAELFFGVKSVVPAFGYFDRSDQQEKNMFIPYEVDNLARTLEKRHDGLLKGGSSYSNIFAGGAEEAPFCIQSMKLRSIFHGIRIRKVAWLFVLNLTKVARIVGLSLLEIGLAGVDFCKGIYSRKNPFKEFNFIFSRLGSCIVLRELIRLRVKIDIARGLPIIHANFVGYDEHAHRRGPDSAFAFWTLKGIDATIKDLVYQAMGSEKRDYRVFIYSDHGQETTIAFERETGTTLHQAVAEVFSHGPLRHFTFAEDHAVIPYLNLRQRSSGLLGRSRGHNHSTDTEKASLPDRIHITAMGPLGHIYLPRQLAADELDHYAAQLVNEAKIPLVLYRRNDLTMCVSPAGSGELSTLAALIFGDNHPFLHEVTQDMELICRHANAGDFVISGWRPHGRSLTFPTENGSHGGPGNNETQGFVIIPDTSDEVDRPTFRPLDLRRQIRSIFDKSVRVPVSVTGNKVKAPEVLTVMSYNIHHCSGMDGKLFPDRIARIIRRQSPDLVALQEVDSNRERSGKQDQARLLSQQLAMHYTFLPLLEDDGGSYGLATLSRYPFAAVNYSLLPKLPGSSNSEQRGVLWVTIETRHGPVHLLNTHLSLIGKERLIQMRHIVEKHQYNELPPAEPIILCGDLNAGARSATYKLLSSRLSDSHKRSATTQPDPTFFSSYPLFRLDHIFASHQLAPIRAMIVNDWECRLASDHLPVVSAFLYDPEVLAKSDKKNHA